MSLEVAEESHRDLNDVTNKMICIMVTINFLEAMVVTSYSPNPIGLGYGSYPPSKMHT